MSDGMVRKWVRQFKESRENVHDEPWNGRPSVVTDDLLQVVEAKLREDRRFTISLLSSHFFTYFNISLLQHCDRMLRIWEIMLKMGAKKSF